MSSAVDTRRSRSRILAGALGAAVAAGLLERGWIERGDGRAVRVTAKCRTGLIAELG